MQVNKIETTKKLKMLELQAEMLKTSKKKYDITDKEVSNLSSDTRFVSILKIVFRKQNYRECLSHLQGLFFSRTNVCALVITRNSRRISHKAKKMRRNLKIS